DPPAGGLDDAGVRQPRDHDEQAHEEHQRGPFDPAQDVVDVDTGHQDHRPGPEQGDDGRLDVHHRVQAEADDHQAEHDQAADQQAAVLDGPPLLQLHDLRDVLGVVLEGPAEHQPAQREEDRHRDDDGRRHVQEEVVEAQPGPAADDDVERVADEGGGAADVGGEHLRDQVGLGRDPQPVAHHQADRRDEHDGGQAVEERGGDRRDGHQHQHQPVRPAAAALGRPDGQVVERAGLHADPDDDHHAEEQEDDVPVDAGVLGEEHL